MDRCHICKCGMYLLGGSSCLLTLYLDFVFITLYLLLWYWWPSLENKRLLQPPIKSNLVRRSTFFFLFFLFLFVLFASIQTLIYLILFYFIFPIESFTVCFVFSIIFSYVLCRANFITSFLQRKEFCKDRNGLMALRSLTANSKSRSFLQELIIIVRNSPRGKL